MDISRRIDLAKDQLEQVLGFFPRVDAKGSVVLAIDTGMLAFLASKTPSFENLGGSMFIAPGLTVLFIAISLGYLYSGGSPSLDGGHQSLIYFREIAKRTETKYVDEFIGITDQKYLKDLLAQVWRNSEILTKKFNHLQTALNFLALAIIPWIVSIMLFAMQVTPVTTK